MKYLCQVIKGAGRGKGLGFPTFNLAIPTGFSAEEGIYASQVWIGTKEYPGAVHLGPIPTFQDQAVSLEVYVLDYQDHEEVTELSLELLKYLRPVRNFESVAALQAQIASDVALTRLAVS